jgi:hypothetical protein
MPDEASRRAVDVAERFADGLVSSKTRRKADRAANRVLQRVEMDDNTPTPEVRAAAAADCAVSYSAAWVPWVTQEANEQEIHANVLRDLFGPLPFRPVSLDPTWLTWQHGTIPKLAQSIYDERAFDRLPVLADALEEAGCADHAILAHLRGPGPHALGCWALDLLLGKE